MNVTPPPQNAPAFLAAGVLPALRAAVSCLSGQVEVVLNAGRILSKLTLHDGCQDAIAADPGYAPLLVRVFGSTGGGVDTTRAASGVTCRIVTVPGACVTEHKGRMCVCACSRSWG